MAWCPMCGMTNLCIHMRVTEKRLNPDPVLAPPVRQTGPETVFQGAGNSHFSHVEGQGFHVTTQVPGIGKREGLPKGLRIHDPIKP